jgi:hypothetical protein
MDALKQECQEHVFNYLTVGRSGSMAGRWNGKAVGQTWDSSPAEVTLLTNWSSYSSRSCRSMPVRRSIEPSIAEVEFSEEMRFAGRMDDGVGLETPG